MPGATIYRAGREREGVHAAQQQSGLPPNNAVRCLACVLALIFHLSGRRRTHPPLWALRPPQNPPPPATQPAQPKTYSVCIVFIYNNKVFMY